MGSGLDNPGNYGSAYRHSGSTMGIARYITDLRPAREPREYGPSRVGWNLERAAVGRRVEEEAVEQTPRGARAPPVVIPKDLRDELGIRPGDEVAFWCDGDHVAIRPVRSIRPLKGRFQGRPLTRLLEDEREADRRRDTRR